MTVTKPQRKPLKLTMPEPLERDIQRAVLQLLEVHPAVHRAWRVNSGAADGEYVDSRGIEHRQWVRFHTQQGHSDITGVLRGGRAFFLECKRPGKEPTANQKGFLDDMAAGGALTGCVHSVDEAKELLDAAPLGCQRRVQPWVIVTERR